MSHTSRADVHILAVAVIKSEGHITKDFIATHSVLDTLHAIWMLRIRVAGRTAIMVTDNCIRCAAMPVHRCQCDGRIQSIGQSDRHGVKSVTIQIHGAGRIIDGFNLENFGFVCILMDGRNATVIIDGTVAVL